MDISLQKQKAEELRALHHASRILVLPNVWDAVSARIVETAGAKAIATSSAAIAFAYGYPDGEHISRKEMLEAVARIAHTVSLPVTADLEAGYSDSTHQIEQLVHEAIASGAVGLNLEDGAGNPPRLRPLELQLEKIRTLREVSDRAGVPFVINARTDVYLLKIGQPDTQFAEAVRRGRAFREAGADCVFVPLVEERDTIAALVKEIGGPINILAGARTPSVAELQKLGVARVSVGSGACRAALAALREVAQELLTKGTYDSMMRNILPSADVNQPLAGKKQPVSG